MLHGACKTELVAAELPLYGPVVGSAHKEQECTRLEAIARRKLMSQKVCTKLSTRMCSVMH